MISSRRELLLSRSNFSILDKMGKLVCGLPVLLFEVVFRRCFAIKKRRIDELLFYRRAPSGRELARLAVTEGEGV